MTIINGFEIDYISYKQNEIKFAIANNEPIENKLNMIIVISNPCLYGKRYILCKEFIKRILEEEENVELFIVELAYNKQKFYVTDSKNSNHLQLRTDTSPIWHKENLINLAVEKLLPKNWKAFAWVDADIEFESPSWALDTLKILNGCKDVVQLFSHCVDMGERGEKTLNLFQSFGYNFCNKKPYKSIGVIDYWHPGYAWAITRHAYEKIGGLYDKGILGSGDNIMALGFINKSHNMMHSNYHSDYNKSMEEFQKKAKKLRIGYVPGVIKHYYHGSKKNRGYTERWEILMRHQYSPYQHLEYDSNGLLIPSSIFTEDFKKDIMKYFYSRREDD